MTGFVRTGYGFRIGVGAVLLVIAVGVVVLLLIDRALAQDLLFDLDHRLEAQARGAATWSGEGRHPERLSARLGAIVDAHVTIFDATGRVLGDSKRSAALGTDESREPEVAEVLRGGVGAVGRASRESPGEGEARYVAVPSIDGKVLRLGAPLAPIQATIARVRLRLAVASGLGVVLAIGLGSVAARLASRPLVRMRDAAHRIAEGDYGVSLPGESPDEFGELEASLSALAARLAADRDRIERLEATRRDFVANVSHELRTPLTAIQGYAETLLRGTADPETSRQFLETMHRQARRVSALVTDLLKLAELEARRPGVAPYPVSVANVAREAIATVKESATTPPSIVLDAPGDPMALGDAAGIEQILENLVENAVRYGEGSEVRVSVHADGDRVRLSVEDYGPGIAAHHLQRLFERFYRTDPARSRDAGGTGLGLSIVKHLAESMGGTVRVESEVGRGTVFTVDLVAERASGDAPRA